MRGSIQENREDAILIFGREATRNAFAALDCVVALSQVSPRIRRTARFLSIFLFVFATRLKKVLGWRKKKKQGRSGYHNSNFFFIFYLALLECWIYLTTE